MWDYIVRGALRLKRKKPSWLNIPQMMRLTITTYNVLEMLREWEIARPYNFLLLPMVDPTFGYAFSRRANEKVLLVCEFSSQQKRWFDIKCVNIHSGKKYRMVDCTKENNPPYNVVFPSQFARLLIEYQEHPEAKSLAPDGSPCEAKTHGLLQRAHITAGEFRYVGKEKGSNVPEVKQPKPEHVCSGCGRRIRAERNHCAHCAIEGATERLANAARIGRIAARSPEARAKNVASRRRHAQACSEWDASMQPAWLTSEVFSRQIQPLLADIPTSAIRSRIGVSRWYAGRIREGYRPHPRHWQALAQLVGRAGVPNRLNAR